MVTSSIDDRNPGFEPLYDEISNPKKKKFTNIIQFIIDLCDFPIDPLKVEYITSKACSTLMDVIMIMVDNVDIFHISKKSGAFKLKPMKLHLCNLQYLIVY
jgi:Fe-S-cluster formation regulator IscX/YfhJ